jgi:outer membrane receptor protein involved in Fe transport
MMNGSAVALVALFAATAALAQQASVDAPATAGALNEIIVTAEKHSESLQKVPLSIVAYTAQTLAEAGVEDFAALAARIPGVTLNSAGPGQSSYSIRGIASGAAMRRPPVFTSTKRRSRPRAATAPPRPSIQICTRILRAATLPHFSALMRCSTCAPAC